MVVLIRRQTVKNRAFAAHDADRPAAGALAVAMRSSDGWKVAAKGGRLVGERLETRAAMALLMSTARDVAVSDAVKALFGGVA